MSQPSFEQSLPENVLGIGVDVVRTERFQDIARRAPSGVAQRLFTGDELARSRAGDCEYLASRFAAKEAVMKSLGYGMSDIPFTDIEICSMDGGAPHVRLSGAAYRLAREAGVMRVLISISHDRDYACAFAIALGCAGNGARTGIGGVDAEAAETCDS